MFGANNSVFGWRLLKKIPRIVAVVSLALASVAAQAIPSAVHPHKQPSGAPKPYGAVPTEQQVAWQRMEFYGFIHFGLNTFTNKEWGYGDEDPTIFNPKKFDADAIVKVCKEAGMAGVIYTAKHHDGFCMWPTKSTSHNITKTPWKNGRGDVVKEFSEACKKEGIKFGTYLSPWDRNHPDYGKRPGDAYTKTYNKQIDELLTNYGPIFEIWFDGANGGDGYYGGAREKRNIGDPEKYYNFKDIVKKIRRIQPDCIIWGAGHYGDARWGGSEDGFVNYPHWHTIGTKGKERGGTGTRDGERWVPAEGDTKVNNAGWFWHPGQDKKVKSVGKLMETWFDCVGRGANLILNVAPNRDGQLDPADVKALLEFKKARDKLYHKDFALNAKTVKASNVRGANFAAKNAVDGDMDTYWAMSDNAKSPEIEITLSQKAKFDVVRVREEIRLGQRVDAWALDAWVDNNWQEVVEGSSIGNQAMLKFPRGAVTTDRVRLRITKSAAAPCISEISLFKFPDSVAISTADSEPVISGIRKNKWKVVAPVAGTNAKSAIDGNAATFWKTDSLKTLPQSLTVNMGETISVKAFAYLPRQDGSFTGMTDRYIFELSLDGKKWHKVAEGEFGNLRASPEEQIIEFTPQRARFFRFTGTRALEGDYVSAAEIGIVKE